MTIIKNVFHLFLMGFFLLSFHAYAGEKTEEVPAEDPAMCDQTAEDGTVTQVPCPEQEPATEKNESSDLSKVTTVASNEETTGEKTEEVPAEDPAMCDQTAEDGTVTQVPCPEQEPATEKNESSDLSKVTTVASNEETTGEKTEEVPAEDPAMCDQTAEDGTVTQVPCPEQEPATEKNESSDLSKVTTVASNEETTGEKTEEVPAEDPAMCDQTAEDGTVTQVPCPEQEPATEKNESSDLSKVTTVASNEETTEEKTEEVPAEDPAMCDQTAEDGTVTQVPCPEQEPATEKNESSDLSKVTTVASNEETTEEKTEEVPAEDPAMCDQTAEDGTVTQVPCPEQEPATEKNESSDLSKVTTVASNEETTGEKTEEVPAEDPAMCDQTAEDGTVTQVPCPEQEPATEKNESSDLSKVTTVASNEETTEEKTEEVPAEDPAMCDQTAEDGTVTQVPCPEQEPATEKNESSDLSKVTTVASNEETTEEKTEEVPAEDPAMCDQTAEDGTVTQVPCPEQEPATEKNESSDLSKVTTVASNEETTEEKTEEVPAEDPAMCDETAKDGTVTQVPCPNETKEDSAIQRKLIDRVSAVIDSYDNEGSLPFREFNERHSDKNVRLFIGEFDVQQNVLRKTVVKPEGQWSIYRYSSEESEDNTTVLFSYDGHIFGATQTTLL